VTSKSVKRVLVCGAGGFIGHHLVARLKADGAWVRGVDVKLPEFGTSVADDFELADLRRWDECLRVTRGIDHVYQLAADMGGIGYITANHADIARNNILINAHMIEAARVNGASRYFFSSSACVYPDYRQDSPENTGLAEKDAYPAAPEEGYGWEKLYTEKICQYYQLEGKLQTRVARFHNIYGPEGTYEGGREKAPAAISRKIALAYDGAEIEVWGDGQQTRSFTYIDDCVEGITRIMTSNRWQPLNLGTAELVTIDQLVDLVARAANKRIVKVHDLSKPQGVRGRNSDNTELLKALSWEPPTTLRVGLSPTYEWIRTQVLATDSARELELVDSRVAG
jgi:GDP-D-mannose 3', 5'-epimerase